MLISVFYKPLRKYSLCRSHCMSHHKQKICPCYLGSKLISNFGIENSSGVWVDCFYNGCSPIKVKENFTPPSSFQRFQICPDIVFLQLTFVNCIIRYTVEYRCITYCSITLDNQLYSFAVITNLFLSE